MKKHVEYQKSEELEGRERGDATPVFPPSSEKMDSIQIAPLSL